MYICAQHVRILYVELKAVSDCFEQDLQVFMKVNVNSRKWRLPHAIVASTLKHWIISLVPWLIWCFQFHSLWWRQFFSTSSEVDEYMQINQYSRLHKCTQIQKSMMISLNAEKYFERILCNFIIKNPEKTRD